MVTHILHRQTTHKYPIAVGGEGPYLFDSNGKKYLDASGGAAVSTLGHHHPRVVNSITEQIEKLAFAHSGFFTNEPAESLAAELTARSPSGGGRVVFVSGGSEAIETAIKLARQIQIERGETQRTHYIARRQSYHGSTLGALALGHHASRRAPYEPLLGGGLGLSNVSHISPCYAYRYQGDDSEELYSGKAAAELEQEILKIGPEKVAAFFAETVSGSSLGAVPPTKAYFSEIRRICDEYGVLLVLDEIMCGMGRTGTMFAAEQENIVPDFVAIAKGLGAGYQPIGALIIRQDLSEFIDQGSGALHHGHTYMSHATACAGALATLRTIEQETLLENVVSMGEYLKAVLIERFGQHPNIGDIRGRGLFWGLEIVRDRDDKSPFESHLKVASRIKNTAMDQGLICYPGTGNADGINGDHILLAPPFIVQKHHLDELVDRLQKTIDKTLP